MEPEEIERVRTRLLEHRKLLHGDMTTLADQALKQNNGSHLPLHMADAGSDTFEQDMALGFVQTEGEEIQDIDDALSRLDDGTFGKCEDCEAEIPPARLEAIPFARLCVPCQELREEE